MLGAVAQPIVQRTLMGMRIPAVAHLSPAELVAFIAGQMVASREDPSASVISEAAEAAVAAPAQLPSLAMASTDRQRWARVPPGMAWRHRHGLRERRVPGAGTRIVSGIHQHLIQPGQAFPRLTGGRLRHLERR